jgi:[acyl-carrier-protein] S-malonyltransferase
VENAIVFPGQGSQFVGMADPWMNHPAGKAVIDEASDVLSLDLASSCRDGSLLASTEFVQPAMFACDVAAFRVLEAEGIGDWVGSAGHSLGEFAALVAAGVCGFDDLLRVVSVRGREMQRAGRARPGSMAALLGVGPQEAGDICDRARGDDVLAVANENSPKQVVISGSIPAIERAQEICALRNVRAVRLNVAGAFHSPLMEPAAQPLNEELSSIAFSAPAFPIAENVTGSLVIDPEELRRFVAQQIVMPVRWMGCVRALSSAGATTFVEAGPGDVLTKLAKRVIPSARAVAVGSPEAASSALA